jgi:TonB family protein
VGYGTIDDDAPLIYTPSKPDAVNVQMADVPASRVGDVIEDNSPVAYTPRTDQTALSEVAGETTVIGLGRASGARLQQSPASTKPRHSNAGALGQLNTADTGGGGDGLAVTGQGLRSRFANDPPEYPLEARRRRMEGTVTLAILIDATGHVADARVARSSGFPILDKSAVDKVLTYRVPPYRENGVAIDVQLLQPFTFKLRG